MLYIVYIGKPLNIIRITYTFFGSRGINRLTNTNTVYGRNTIPYTFHIFGNTTISYGQ